MKIIILLTIVSLIYCKDDKNQNDNDIDNQINYFNDNKIKIAREGFNKTKEDMVKDDMMTKFNDLQILIIINKEKIYKLNNSLQNTTNYLYNKIDSLGFAGLTKEEEAIVKDFADRLKVKLDDQQILIKNNKENIYKLNNSLNNTGNYLFKKVDSLESRFNQSINRNITKSEIESIKKLNNSIKNTKNLIIERIKDSEFQVHQLIQKTVDQINYKINDAVRNTQLHCESNTKEQIKKIINNQFHFNTEYKFQNLLQLELNKLPSQLIF